MAKNPALKALARKKVNPVDYVDGAALGRHLRGGVKFPKAPKAGKTPTTVIAGTKSNGGASRYAKGSKPG